MLTPEMFQFISSWQFDLDDDKESDAKIFKGRNWRDTSDYSSERYLNKYSSSSTIGSRCVMDRLGPVKKK